MINQSKKLKKIMLTIYVPNWNPHAQEVFGACIPDFYKGTVVIIQTLDELQRHVAEIPNRLRLLILLIDKKEQLHELQTMRKQLMETITIIVVPNNEYETLSLGYSFFPKYIAQIDGNLEFLNGVVNSMATRFIEDRFFQ